MTHSLRSLLIAIAVAVLLGTASTATARADEVVVGTLVPGSEKSEPAAWAKGSDATLRKGCRDYPLRYTVKNAGDDWLLTLVVHDRSGEEVASLNLHGVQLPSKGTTTFSVCRSAVRAGRFTVTGELLDRDGYEQTEHPVAEKSFRLTRR
jgi:hypothetical protein